MMKTKPSSKKNKQVKFSPIASVRPTIPLSAFSLDEIEATWYSQDEFTSMKKSCVKQVIKMDNGEILKDKKYCSRGLEKHTRIGSIANAANKRDSIQAVLEEQHFQIENGSPYDGETIARVYSNVTFSCQLWATSIGLADQRAAERYQDEDDTTDATLPVPTAVSLESKCEPAKSRHVPSTGRIVQLIRKVAHIARSA